MQDRISLHFFQTLRGILVYWHLFYLYGFVLFTSVSTQVHVHTYGLGFFLLSFQYLSLNMYFDYIGDRYN